MKKHANIPVFIPHLGCPNQCVFCNQRTISGVSEFRLEQVQGLIEDALATIGDGVETEIAFFGGSFTGIDRELMLSLLEIAHSYVLAGHVTSIRCSTRPDYIDEEIIGILKKYDVKTVELGLQSTSEAVLFSSKRGHGFDAEMRACKLIVDAGIELVGQMMIGLPSSTLESELVTADFIIESGASAARIYPTVVFRETELCEMAKAGAYLPLSLEDACARSAAVLDKFINAGVEVIRIGLCASENLSSEAEYFAGPNHSALGELVENELFYAKIAKSLRENNCALKAVVKIEVAKGCLSKAIGQQRKNKEKLKKEFNLSQISFSESEELSGYDFRIEIDNGKE